MTILAEVKTPANSMYVLSGDVNRACLHAQPMEHSDLEDKAAQLRFSITCRAACRLRVNCKKGKYQKFNGKKWETCDLPDAPGASAGGAAAVTPNAQEALTGGAATDTPDAHKAGEGAVTTAAALPATSGEDAASTTSLRDLYVKCVPPVPKRRRKDGASQIPAVSAPASGSGRCMANYRGKRCTLDVGHDGEHCCA